MKPIKRTAGCLVAGLAATLLVVACGDDSPGATEPPPPPNRSPVANAGIDLETSRGFSVTLNGAASADPDDQALTFVWTQVAGPDVTLGEGFLTGATPTFPAPTDVSSLVFELRVSDGDLESEPDSVAVRVFEDQNAMFFVDGDSGDDELGNGSRKAPFASLGKALCEVTDVWQDIYVMTRADGARYDETVDPCPGEPARDPSDILLVPTGTSLYGGFDGEWIRDVGAGQTGVDILHHGVRFEWVDANAWLSGFDIRAADSPNPDESTHAVRAVGGSATLTIADNTLVAGGVGFGEALLPGTSHGIVVALLERVYVARNIIAAGRGGDAQAMGNVFRSNAPAGGDAVGTTAGYGSGWQHFGGGSGGAYGTEGGNNGAHGNNGAGPGGATGGQGGCGGGQSSGGYGCVGDSGCGNYGRPGAAGPGGSVGARGVGGSGTGWIDAYIDGGAFASYRGGDGAYGRPGSAGCGGGGGGGGEACWGVDGGRGGGGGGGGAGGDGGPAGRGGGASIGIMLAQVVEAEIVANQIDAEIGGVGATGAPGQLGGGPGSGGAGNSGNSGLLGTGGNGGNGGSGGAGAAGGHGGAGGGGPSIGVLVGAQTAPFISGNSITTRTGGTGGHGDEGHGGEGGFSYGVYDVDLGDEAVPVLSDNAMLYGEPGAGGTSSAGVAGKAGLAGTCNF